MEKEESVFQYADPIDFLKFVFEKKRAKNYRFSLRAWARQLGYQNPSFLSHILNRRRRLSFELGEKISTNLGLPPSEKKAFELLILLKNSKTEEEKKLYISAFDSLRTSQDPEETVQLEADRFQLISEWYHTAILQMVQLRDFKSDLEYISRRLGNLSRSTVAESLSRLLRLGLLERTGEGELKRSSKKNLFVGSPVPSEAIRSYHQQMLTKANEAIEGQSMNERELRSTTVAIRMDRYSEAQEIIRRAHDEILQLSVNEDGDEIYQLNTQFFRITENGEKV